MALWRNLHVNMSKTGVQLRFCVGMDIHTGSCSRKYSKTSLIDHSEVKITSLLKAHIHRLVF